MVGAITTADELNYVNIRGFIRVAPSNRDYVQSLAGYLQHRPELDSAILVYDSNSDDPNSPDLFTRSLRDDLRSGMNNLIKFPAQGFTGTSGNSRARPDLFNATIANLCAVKPKVVLCAGRSIDLLSFLQSLEGRVCPDIPMTVVTGGSDLGTFKKDEAKLREEDHRGLRRSDRSAQLGEQGARHAPTFRGIPVGVPRPRIRSRGSRRRRGDRKL
jgi:hypothetical protein